VTHVVPFDEDGLDDVSIEELRGDLRALWTAAPRGRWEAAVNDQALPGAVVAIDASGRRSYIGTFFYGDRASRLAAKARNSIPRLFREIDELRAQLRGIPILGTVS
jgi:hypothetical protein